MDTVHQLFPRFFLFIVALLLSSHDADSQSKLDTTAIYFPAVRQRVFPASDIERDALPGPRIGLVLSGGGARGIAQIGVLKALEEAHVPISFIVGTSVGSVVGGLYAAGYTVADLEKMVHEIDWSVVMRFSNQADREELLFEKRSISDQSIFTIRFDGLAPILPRDVSNGQRLTNLLNLLVLQTLYRPRRSFDDLRIPFRAVTTDLFSGRRVVLERGNLAEAIRASATVPVFYSPLQRDSLALVDGGLITNIPVDVAREQHCDLIIAVNTTSDFRTPNEIGNPLQTLDQVMNVMMAHSNAAQLRNADCVISPDIRGISSFDFSQTDSLIRQGYIAARQSIGSILAKLDAVRHDYLRRASAEYGTLTDGIDSVHVVDVNGSTTSKRTTSLAELERSLPARFDDGLIAMQITKNHDADPPTIVMHARSYPPIAQIECAGSRVISGDSLLAHIRSWIGAPSSHGVLRTIAEQVLRYYRINGYSLATVESLAYDEATRSLRLHVNEGIVGDVVVRGNTRTNTVVILREFPIRRGDVFRIEQARDGLANLNGLGLFHQVQLEIDETLPQPTLTIRVEERSSQLVRLGVHVDDERNAQFIIDARDENLAGTGTELSGTFYGGLMNRLYTLRYTSNRVYWTTLLINARAYWGFRDMNLYTEKTGVPSNRFERINVGTYRRTAFGATVAVGSYVERFGNVTASLRAEQQELNSIKGEHIIDEKQRTVAWQVGMSIDSKDRYPYARDGVKFEGYYESAQAALGSQAVFAKVYLNYEFYATLGGTHTIHPRLQFGYGDKTLPLAEQFSLGGQPSFFGMRENEFFGRQIFSASLEYRYLLPVRLLFDSYVSVRYDLGSAWEMPETVRFRALRHGVGFSLGLDTPLGPADFSIGRSFLFRLTPTNPEIIFGPYLLYFSIGVGI